MEVNMPSTAIMLKGIFLAHLVLTVWSQYCMNGTMLYNSAFLFLVLWSILHRDSEEGPVMALIVNLFSILLDIMVLVVLWPYKTTSFMRFSLAMAVFNLLLRPVTCLMLSRVIQQRTGSYGSYGNSGLDRIFGGARRSPYEDIDQPQPQTNPPVPGGDQQDHRPSSPPSESLFTT